MRAVQKLVKNGNSTAVSIPRQILVNLGWLPGQIVILELREDDTLHVRRPTESDYGAIVGSRMLPITSPTSHK